MHTGRYRKVAACFKPITNNMPREFIVIADYPNTKFEIGEILIQYFFETSTTGMYCYTTRPDSPLEGSSINAEFVENMPHIFKELHQD